MMKVSAKSIELTDWQRSRNLMIIPDDSYYSTIITDEAIILAVFTNGKHLSYPFDRLNKKPLFEISTLDEIKGHNLKYAFATIQYILEILDVVNPYIIDQTKELIGKILSSKTMDILINLIKYVAFQPAAFEKMLKTLQTPAIISHLSALNNTDLLEDKGKLSKTFSVSTDTLKILKRHKLDGYISSIKIIGDIDQNYGQTFADLIISFEKAAKKHPDRIKQISSYSIEEVDNLAKNIKWLLENGYTFKSVCNYLIKISLLFDKNSLPFNAATTLVDYAKIGLKMETDFDRYPVYLDKMHNIFVRNYTCLNDPALKEAFVNKAKELLSYERYGEKASLIVPKTINELVHEGNTLHHCVATYGEKIVNDESIVLFYRTNKSLDQPFITVEVSKNGTLIQAKGAFNVEVTNEDREDIKKLLIQGGLRNE